MFRRTIGCAAVAIILLVGAAACTDAAAPQTEPGSASPTGTGAVATPSSTPTAASPSAGSTKPPRNDLAKGTLQRGVQTGPLTLTIDYTAGIPVKDWKPDGLKPIGVSLSVYNTDKPGQSIYVTRATARFSVSDVNGVLPPPDPVVDTANIGPGYLASFPYTYEQQFAVPRLDPGSVLLTIQFKYELVTLIDKKNKDYTKQTATDTLVVPLTF